MGFLLAFAVLAISSTILFGITDQDENNDDKP